uniref:Protein phosphatase 1 regulatory subunit 15B n=1 Tax=Geotrypetes seraphini TaxID=260995 RepID=A0A6P8PHT7_GEOSA|nr:protein phosphatase 1 regulatory subunit 15B [Geotrypetes seraphini]
MRRRARLTQLSTERARSGRSAATTAEQRAPVVFVPSRAHSTAAACARERRWRRPPPRDGVSPRERACPRRREQEKPRRCRPRPEAAMEPGSWWLKLLERLVPGRWLRRRDPAEPQAKAAVLGPEAASKAALSLWEAELLDGRINNMVAYVLGPAQCLSWAGQGHTLGGDLSVLQEALRKMDSGERALYSCCFQDDCPRSAAQERLPEIHQLRMKRLQFLQQSRLEVVPSPEQDHGYCSLEEGHSLQVLLKPDPCQTCEKTGQGHTWVADDSDSEAEEDLPRSSRPVCNNKLIGYILGAVSSDEEDTSSESEEDWGEDEGEEEEGEGEDDDDDDDGFNSEGTLSDSDSRNQDYDSLQLFNSLYRVDPYNPQNFTATIQTEASLVEDMSPKSEGASWCESPPGSQFSTSGEEDDSEESADEAENMKLWNAFRNCEDPYNPLNFKATFQTAVRKHPGSSSLDKQGLTNSQCCDLPYWVQPKENHGGEILNTDQEDGHASQEASTHAKRKKVTFLDKITEYYVSNEEDRKGCWEEFARDRYRFQKRIQEIEKVIGYCLSTEHRQKIQDQLQNGCS